MAKKHTVNAEPRARTGSGLLKLMRREGWLPSVVYGKGLENKNLKVDAKSFNEMLSQSASQNILVNLDVAGESSMMAFLQDVQHDPLSGAALHADFRAVDNKTEIQASVPVNLTGTAKGLKSGGVVEQMFHTLDIRCLASHLPDSLDFDITSLDRGDSLHISDVTFPEGVVPQYEAEVVIVHIGNPTIEEETDDEPEAGETPEAVAGEDSAESESGSESEAKTETES